MPGDGHRRPKNNGEKPDEDKNQRDRMRDDFDQSTSGAPKDRNRSNADEQREFAAYPFSERLSASRLAACFRLSRHAREDIESVLVAQSPNAERRHYRTVIPSGARNLTFEAAITPATLRAAIKGREVLRLAQDDTRRSAEPRPLQ